MRRKGFGILLLGLLLMVFLTPGLRVSASSGYYEITDFNLTVDLQGNGDAQVVERITYDFQGGFNGVLRNIDYSRTSGLADLAVFVQEGSTLREFKEDVTGGAQTYERSNEGSLVKLKVYERSDQVKKTFVYRYTLKNVAEKYNDIGIFNRKIIDTRWDVPLNNINITITIPAGATKDQLKVFAHGPLTGTSTIVDDRTFTFTVPSVNGVFVETLVIFPPALLPSSTNVFARDELPSILANEQRLADEANKAREEAQKAEEARLKREKLRQDLLPVFAGGIAAAILSLLAMVRKFSKELKPEFMGDYYRELPEDYTPAVMSYLLSKGRTKDDDIMATLMDLARKKVITLTPITVESGKIFRKEEDSVQLQWLNKEKLSTLMPHERFLAEWFLDDIGGGQGLILDDLETIVKKKKAALQFQNDYEYFKVKVKDVAETQGFFMANNLQGAAPFIVVAILFMGVGVITGVLLGSVLAFLIAGLGLLMLITLMGLNFVRKLSRKGTEHTAMWKAFKKFLLDFSNLKEAEIPSIVIWEHYLVYATALGVADQVIEQLPKVFSEADLSNPDLTYMGGYRSFNNIYIMNHAFNNTMSKVSSAVNAAQIANSAKSSGSGFGGGFSGGSSGGGGGGGGGGAF